MHLVPAREPVKNADKANHYFKQHKPNGENEDEPGTCEGNPFIFRMAYGHGIGPALLRNTLLEQGLVEFDPHVHQESQWHLWWKGYRFKDEDFLFLKPTQRVNHHPPPTGQQADIIKKDGLLRAVRRMCATYPQCAPLLLLPTSFHLPREESKFVATFCQNCRPSRTKLTQTKHPEPNGRPHVCTDSYSDCCSPQMPPEAKTSLNIWIVKPAEQARGKGIYLFNQLDQFTYLCKSVVQKYITDPLLIEGHKFDLRLYAIVPSYAPFIVYIHSEGLVRFATEPFDLTDLKNVYSHLTNSSINVNGPKYLTNKNGIGRGCKWTLTQLRQWLTEHNLNSRYLWARVKALIILTLLSQASSVPKAANAYELFGFDILIDSRLRPWLLEVNANPSMSGDCIVDELVKKPLITSILSMLRLGQHSKRSNLLDPTTNWDTPHKPTSRRNIRLIKEPLTSSESSAKTKEPNYNSEDLLFESTNNLSLRVNKFPIYSHNENASEGWQTWGSPDNSLGVSRGAPSSSIGSIPPAMKLTSTKLHNKFNALHRSILINQPRVNNAHPEDKQCPLYGPGSELLLPQLKSLGDLFPRLLDTSKNPSSKTRSSLSTFETSNISEFYEKHNFLKAAGEYSERIQSQFGSQTDGIKLDSKQMDQHCSNQLIPQAFGLLRLAFPFNLSTRIACAKGRVGYPDVKSCVRQICRLTVHHQREEKEQANIRDPTVIDIPDIWSGDI